MKKVYCASLLVLLFVTGCVSSTTVKPALTQESTALFNEHMDKGLALERENNLKTALEEFKLAATVDPESKIANQKINSVETILQQRAEDHYQKGLGLDKQGKYEMARKEYLAAIQNWPDHAMAMKVLSAGQVKEEMAYIVHTIRPGESLSKLAIFYYDNYKLYPQIGKFNTLKNATQVQVGQKIMIPAIEGVSLADLEKRQKVYLAALENSTTTDVTLKKDILPGPVPEAMKSPEPEVMKSPEPEIKENRESEIMDATEIDGKDAHDDTMAKDKVEEIPLDSSSKSVELVPVAEKDVLMQDPLSETDGAEELPGEPLAMVTPEPEVQPGLTTETADGVKIYLEQGIALFDQKEYELALVELNLAKQAEPENPKVLDYLFKAHFQRGLIQHSKGEFLEAEKSFDAARENNPACEKCAEYMVKSRDAYKEKHYTMGIYFFGKEQLKEAIAQWELVRAVDPAYKDVLPNLKKAEMLSQRLETIKKSDD